MKTEVVQPDILGLSKAAKALRNGELVGMPTETVYGLAGLAFNEETLLKIFETKARPTFDPLIVHIPPDPFSESRTTTEYLHLLGLVDLERISPSASPLIERLSSAFWPGPLTLVLPKGNRVPELATSGLNTVAIRMPSHPVAQDLLRLSGGPLAAPSANQFGKISPTCAKDVESELGEKIPYILDGGKSEVGLESSVIEVTEDGNIIALRPGAISVKAIESLLERKVLSNENLAKNSPGMLANHYAPEKPLYLLPKSIEELDAGELLELSKIEKPGFLLFKEQGKPKVNGIVEPLTKDGDAREAAQNLFEKMRILDESEAKIILVEPRESISNTPLGLAISDRLGRASSGEYRFS